MEKIFKNLVIASAVLLTYFFIAPDYLPENLQAINDAKIEELFNTNFFLIGFILWVLAIYVSYYLIYKFKKIGRTIFLITIIVIFPLNFYLGAEVLHPIDSSVDFLLSLVDGALLTLMYVSPLKDRFA